jgi:RimJ/RimL family protein N-acetyltransferase
MSASVPFFLIGSTVALRPVEPADLPAIRTWLNDPQLRALIGETRPLSLAAAEAYVDKLQRDPTRVWLMIVERATGRPIGECGLLRMMPDWRTTDLSIILGEPASRGRGYGTEAITLLMDYAFGALNFHRIAIGVVGFNTRALRFYEKVGFQQEGIQRDGYYYQHRYHDFVMMSILAHEFRALHGPAVPSQPTDRNEC